MRRIWLNGLTVLWAGLATSGVRAGLPIETGPAPGQNTNPTGIAVPAPLRAGTEANAPAPPAPATGKTGLRLYPAPRAANDWLRLQDQDAVTGRFLGWEDGAVQWEMTGALRPVRFRNGGVDRLVWAAPENAARRADRWVVRLPLQFLNLRDRHGYLDLQKNRLVVQQQGGGLDGAGGLSAARPRGDRPRVGVALHPGTGSLAVYVDGKLVGNQQANVPMGPVPRGMAVQDSGTGGLPIRTLLITPIREELSLPVAPGNADLIRLANGDVTVGTLTGLTAAKLSFTGSLGELELPLERLVGVVFATAGRNEPRRRDNDVQLHFHDGGQLVAELKEVTADQVIVVSDAFGRATVPRAVVQRLQLGLHRPAPPAANPDRPRETQPGTLGLRGGRLLSGQLLGVTAQTVTWQHPHALDPLELALTNVVFVNLATAGALTNLPPLPARVRLTNGDQLRGELVGVDAQSVQLRPWHTGPVRLPRQQVAELRPGGPGEGVLDAGSMGNWHESPRPGPTSPLLYRCRLPLPPRVRLQLEVESRGKAGGLYLQAWLYGQDADFTRSKTYTGPLGCQLTLQTDRVTSSQFMLSPDGTPLEQNRASHRAPGLGQRPVSEITWLLDTVKAEAFVLLDGEQIGHIRDLVKTDLGQEIRLAILHPRFARLRSFMVTEWKGGTDFAAAAQSDTIRLHDFSLLAGPVEGVRDGLVYRAGQAPVPLAKVSAVVFDPTAAEPVRRTAQDARVTLWDGDELTLANLEATARGLTGTSAAWGELTLPAAAIRRLDFQPHDPPPAANPAGPRTSDSRWEF